jgi:hypothetical protein
MSMAPSAAVRPSSAPFGRPEGSNRTRAFLILSAVIIALACTIAAALVPVRVFWLYALLHLGPILASLAALLASSVLGRTRPTAFTVRDGVGFVAPTSRGYDLLVVGEVMMVAFVISQLIRLWTWNDAPAAAYVWNAVLSLAVLIFCGFVALLVITALRGGPRILLTSRGIVQQDMWADRVIPWEALRPGQPLYRVRGRILTLIVDRPELVVRHGFFRTSSERPRLVLDHLRVHPRFLAHAICFYVGRPEHRSALGALAEYEHLRAELGVPAGA